MEKGGREVNKWLKTLDIRTEYLLYHAIMLFEDNTFHNTWKKKVVKNDDIYCWQFLIYECVKWNRYKKAQTSGSFQLGFKSSRLLYQTTSYIEKVFSNQSSSSGWHSSIWSHIEIWSPQSWPSSGLGSGFWTRKDNTGFLCSSSCDSSPLLPLLAAIHQVVMEGVMLDPGDDTKAWNLKLCRPCHQVTRVKSRDASASK